MAHFILVHGMFHAGWCWAPLAERLRAVGHRVDTPDLAGCGPGAGAPAEASLEGWARSIAALAEGAGERVVLVGHSRGGIVISQAAEQAPDPVAALVYIAALMLPDGVPVMDLPRIVEEEGFATRPGDMAELDMTGDGLAVQLKPAALDRLYAPVAPALRDWALPQVSAEPVGPLLTPLALTDARYGRVPRIYVAAEQDQLLPYEAQQAMIARSAPAEVHLIDGEHQVILTHVDELAALLIDVAGRYG